MPLMLGLAVTIAGGIITGSILNQDVKEEDRLWSWFFIFMGAMFVGGIIVALIIVFCTPIGQDDEQLVSTYQISSVNIADSDTDTPYELVADGREMALDRTHTEIKTVYDKTEATLFEYCYHNPVLGWDVYRYEVCLPVGFESGVTT